MPMKIFEKLCSSNNGPVAGKSLRLPFMQRIFYGVGHVFNDLCANCWFSYLLLYMTKVVSLSNASAGLVLLIGQVADAIFTPFIGYGCDKTNIRCYGRRKLWHLIGTICVLLSFPFIFNLCLSCENSKTVFLVLYYSAFVVVFQFGWASVQISHLSLIPEIARKVSQKVELNAIRSGLTFVCGIYVFGVTWLLLGTNPDENVTRTVAPQFMYLSFIVVGTGCLFSLIFHFGTKEPRNYGKRKDIIEDKEQEKLSCGSSNDELIYNKSPNQQLLIKSSSNQNITNQASVNQISSNHETVNQVSRKHEQMNQGSMNHESLDHESSNHESVNQEIDISKQNGNANGLVAVSLADDIGDDIVLNDENLLQTPSENKEEKCKNWKEWFKSPFFYKMAVIYMCTRLTLNVSQAYFVLYLTETMNFEKEAIAYFPLLVLVSGVISSILVKILTKRIGARFTFIIGCLSALISFVWLFIVTTDTRKSVYVAALLMGGGTSIMLITSLAMTANLIGSHKGSCAFVYSSMSFTDKLSSGIVIYVIQLLKPKGDSGIFTKYVQTVVTGVSCLIGLAFVAIFFPSDYPKKNKKNQRDGHTQTLISEAKEEETNQGSSEDLAMKDTQHASREDDIDLLDDNLKRLSWHSSMTSYVAWRLASPHMPSPEMSQRTNESTEDDMEV